MSLTADASGLKLVGDSASPGNNKVYGTDGSGNKGWQTAPGNTPLYTSSNSNVGTIDITGLTGYAWYLIQAWNLRNNGGAMAALYLQTSSNGGSTFDNGVSDYSYSGAFANDSKWILLSSFAGNGVATNSASLTLWLPGLAGVSIDKMMHGMIVQAFGSNPTIATVACMRLSTSIINAVRLWASSGNIDGEVRVYGIN
jgi:hypothetical protein